MIVYSKKIIKFIHEIKSLIKYCLSKEIGLRVDGERFYDRKQNHSYAIKVVIYNNKSMLGYFNPDFHELGFHESLMNASKHHLENIIRHEIAHYVTFINYGPYIQPHGIEFRTFCESMKWGEQIYKATTCLDDGTDLINIEESGVLRKVKKLMALATSSNSHEAEQAMIVSQQLLLKHNIDSRYIDQNDDEKIFLKRVIKQNRENAKMRAIAFILDTFFVNTVYSRNGDFIYLEIAGSSTNIEIAEYVANFLQHELDRLWSHAKGQHTHLKGLVAKNSFFLGIAKGYCDKINFLKRGYDSNTAHALMVIEKQLIDAKAMIYPRLVSSKSNARYCHESSSLGQQVGKQLSINPAIGNTSENSRAALTYAPLSTSS